ncbi:putative hydrolase [Cyphellophora attinorum]|uniref:Putative hydrolase n=1 Tax=Cyphellophora attinorum TaxID=1664694 RepID=A0A0N1H664_9EURO|nr:putative hydrolase [Phialophora attinorum]KPI41464.1 putative hydrolase [Phialophora attinorum]
MTHTPKTTTSFTKLPNGIEVFSRTAGPSDGPVILLLHGFPASSFQFRNLIPLLAAHNYRIIAPDLPGFGFTTIPASLNYTHTFANLATTIGSFLDVLSIKKYVVYIFDYGAPTGLRLMLERPGATKAIISQNGNAYDDGIGPFWDPVKTLWAAQPGTQAEKDARNVLQGALLTHAATKWQYTEHEPHPELVDPASWTLDWALMNTPENIEVQLDLFRDYGSNVELYPEFQRYFREKKLPVLAVWGKDDEIFINPGATAFKRDLPDAEVHLLDGGHFLVEAQTERVGVLILEFLKKNGI